MAMKKKFLALAMAAAVAFPGGAYASNLNNTIETPSADGTTKRVESVNAQESIGSTITVNGTVNDKNNKNGKIQVEIPTAMLFTVTADSEVIGNNYQVKNLGDNDIEVSVSAFGVKNGDMDIVPEDLLKTDRQKPDSYTYDRTDVALTLNGNVDGQPKSVDLGKVATGATMTAEEKIITKVAGGGNGMQTITLSGIAGKGQSDIADAGTSGEFTLSFLIKKK